MTALMDRRRFERFALQPMYTEIRVQRINDGRMDEIEGFAYDVSEGGMRIELDERLDVAEHVNVTLRLPCSAGIGEELNVRAAAQVVWVNDQCDDPAMPRMALRITKYFDEATRRALLRYLGSGSAPRVA